jgi:signal transduction histidine kinase
MAAKPCLLVVDDEPDLVQSVKDLLRFDYRVLGTTRASEGLEIMQREPVQIVMSDQRMPEMTGVELLRRVKEMHPATIRLLFTAYSDLTAVIDAINQGSVYRYISKPFEFEDLKAVLRQAYEYYQLQEERRQLTQQLQETNLQLVAANLELLRANDLKKAFIKVASHELRTPLTILLGLSEQANRLTLEHPVLNVWTERIHHAGVRLHERVDQMVKLLLAEHFERPLQPREVDVAELIHGAIHEVIHFVEMRQQTLQQSVPDDLGSIAVEPDKIRDSIVQLLINAVKFTPNGGAIELSASRSILPSPSGRGAGGEGTLRIVVADTGMGIEPDNLARIFEPFFTRSDVSRHSSGTFEYDKRGLGLGLAVAKAFVEMHGGRLSVTSQLGKGTTFTLELPATRPQEHYAI